MNEKFMELPLEKRMRIIDAGLEVFACNEYKNAVTDDIAAKAGISKGLLFYYFHNKIGLYAYLMSYANDITKERVDTAQLSSIRDFFDVMEYGAKKKAQIMVKNPYLMDFVMRGYFSSNAEVQKVMAAAQTGVGSNEVYEQYFKNLDYYKFKDGVEPEYLLQMLTWMTQGYLQQKRSGGASVDLDTLMSDYRRWAALFRKIAYREEYQ